jgi:hypothetical protein
MNYKDLKKEISEEFSDMEEIDGIFKPVEFSGVFSHDRIIEKQIEKGLLASELHRKPNKPLEIDNRFLSKRMREIMYLPVTK